MLELHMLAAAHAPWPGPFLVTGWRARWRCARRWCCCMAVKRGARDTLAASAAVACAAADRLAAAAAFAQALGGGVPPVQAVMATCKAAARAAIAIAGGL